MTPLEYIAIASAGAELLKIALPQIRALIASGQITVEQQLALQAKLDALRGEGAFTGAEWTLSSESKN